MDGDDGLGYGDDLPQVDEEEDQGDSGVPDVGFPFSGFAFFFPPLGGRESGPIMMRGPCTCLLMMSCICGHTSKRTQGDEEGSKKLQEMEEELAKLKAMQEKVKMEVSSGQETGTTAGAVQSIEAREEVDGRSIYVGNVDYGERERETTLLAIADRNR